MIDKMKKDDKLTIEPIAYIHTAWPEKFGVPRQSGLVQGLESRIVFEKDYRKTGALRGLEDFDYIWVIWAFSEHVGKSWAATVRPPVLGGNERRGVFATRSPFRPNALGFSCVRLLRIENTEDGPVLVVDGADMMDGTPIYDIKPYLPQAECHPEARGGFGHGSWKKTIAVDFPEALLGKIAPELRRAACDMLAQNPVPRYQSDEERVYGVAFDCYNIRFSIEGERLMVKAVEVREDV